MDAALHGTLNLRDGCFRVGSTVIVWPHGYRAATNPPRIIDDKGHVYARVGQVVTLGGGGAPTNMTARQLVAAYPALRRCLPDMPCFSHPNPVLGCLNDLWFA
jgi:hypothetical protein